MLACSDQRWSALRAARKGSLPALMFGCREDSEDESAIVMVWLRHLT
jgi:hypothetical protein